MSSPKQKIQREYFSISETHEYSGISERKLWEFLNDPINPLPHFRVGQAGRIVRVKRADFDTWIESYRSIQDADIDRIVEDVLNIEV